MMTTLLSVKIWKLATLFLCLLVTTNEGRHVYGNNNNNDNKDNGDNDSNLYFNGGEEQKNNEFKITEKDLPRDGELFEGDMVMDSALRRRVLGEESKKAAVRDSKEDGPKHWPNGVVPYIIDSSTLPEIEDKIPEAIDNFKKYTCILYREKTPDDVDYVVFKKGTGCSSSVGRQGGEQSIHFAHGCRRIGTIMHEMMHALGIVHEQSRPDRDKYLDVKMENIKKGLERNFMKYKYYQADTLDTPYNYWSVMHYSNYAFSKNDEPTLISKYDENLKFGQRKMLSKLDVQQINTLYPCGKTYSEEKLHADMTASIIEKQRRDPFRYLRGAWSDIFERRRLYKK